MIDRYLVGAVTLSRMTATQRASVFMCRWCRIPEEILFEAQGLPDSEALKQLIYPITTMVLDKAKTVMATIKPEDKVVDLYRNKGNGDVTLLATALTETECERRSAHGGSLDHRDGKRWLTKQAAELSVLTCTPDEIIAQTGNAALRTGSVEYLELCFGPIRSAGTAMPNVDPEPDQPICAVAPA